MQILRRGMSRRREENEMRQAPIVAPNKYNLHGRVQELEVAVQNAASEIKRLDAKPQTVPTTVVTSGPKGERGPKGDKGDPGHDSSVAGPAGRDGLHGRNGKDCQCRTTDVEQRVEKVAQNLADSRLAVEQLREQVADIALQCRALRDMNVKSADYIEFLKSKTAAALAKGKQ
jgi:hypothetical protein